MGDAPNFDHHDGLLGAHVNTTAPGAWPRNTRVKKRNSEAGDATPNGTGGRVLGSLASPLELRNAYPDLSYCYFVEWDDKPGIAIGTIDLKVELAESVQ